MSVGYVPGGYDLFHIGHLNILKAARGHCKYLIAGVATDASLMTMKGRAPVVPFEERFQIVAGIRDVDRAVPDFSQDKRVAWRNTHFDILFKGTDWQGTERGDRLEEQMSELGVTVVYLPYTDTTSSTKLRSFLDLQLTVQAVT